MVIIGALAFGIGVFFAFGLAMGKAPHISMGPKNKPTISPRQIWLTQTGLDLTPAQYYAGLGVVGLLVFGLVSALTGAPFVGLAPAVGAIFLPHAFFSTRRRKNMARTAAAWPDAILELTSSIEANSSLQGALVALSFRGPEALLPAFERFPALATTIGVVPALEVVRERLSDPTSDRVIEVLILAHERGGGIVTDILRDLAHATNEDLQLLEEIESSQLEQKINARAVFVIPWAVLVLLVASSDMFKGFYTSPGGLITIIGGGIWSAIGIVIIGQLAKQTPETRVFGGAAKSRVVEAELVKEEVVS